MSEPLTHDEQVYWINELKSVGVHISRTPQYRAGRVAYTNGTPRTENPYGPAQPTSRALWDLGWYTLSVLDDPRYD